MKALNLQARLALIMALTIALALSLQGVLGYVSFYRMVLWDLDRDLREFTRETTEQVLKAEQLKNLQVTFPGYVVHARLTDLGGKVVQNLSEFPTELQDAPLRNVNYTVGRWRVTHVPIMWGSQNMYLQTALTSQEFTLGLQNHRLTMLTSAAIVILLGASLAYALSGYALRPLRVLTEVCTRIARSGSLDTPVPNPSHTHGEIRDLSVAFNDMVRRLADFRSREATFNRQASHELRTPLTAMRLSLDAARSGYTDPLEALDVLDQELRRTQRLTNSLLILAREGRLAETQPVNVARLSQDGAATAGASYIGPGDAWVRGDETLIRRALENLLENAARYAPNSPATLTVQVAPGTVNLSVQDWGPGLPEDLLPRITEEFYRAAAPLAGETSSGLGLSVVQHVMNAHQGELHIENTPPHGLRVTLRFPVTQAALNGV